MLGGLAADPAWWSDRNVTTGDADNDYAAANAGQLKWFATNAFDELDENLPGGAGAAVEALVEGFTASNNYAIVNLGQLKYVAQPFYDRLIAEGYTTQYPWTTAVTDDVNYAVANIGQMKSVFNFDLLADSDEDGLPDWWEQHHFGNLDQDGSGDYDGDGLSNAAEWANETDPTDTDTDDDGMPDGWEVDNNLDPRSANGDGDADADGVSNLREYRLGSDPWTGSVSDTNGVVQLQVFTLLE